MPFRANGRGSAAQLEILLITSRQTQQWIAKLLDEWQESEWRKRHWFSQAAACDAVQEPELREIIHGFLPQSA